MKSKAKILHHDRKEKAKSPTLTEMESGKTAVKMENITKYFPNVVANHEINFDVKFGEIHALLGENGAGKTTLMNILYGLYQQDEGEIYICGEKVKINSPKKAIKLGIGKVHQLFKQVHRHTVAENIALSGSFSQIFPVKKIKDDFKEFSKEFGWKINLDAKIWQLSASERQQVEILKTLYQGGKILIFDEPTSVLTPKKAETLFKMLKRIRKQGYAIIYITHKLEEVLEISDRVTVLREGRKVKTLPTSNVEKRSLARLMVGQEVLFDLEKEDLKRESPVLEVEGLHVRDDQGKMAVKGISFTVNKNEILGLAGIGGNGQRELIEALAGLRKVEKGEFYVSGKRSTNAHPRKIKERGVAYVPEERTRRGLIPQMSVKENLILRDYYKNPYCRRFLLNMNYVKKIAKERVNQYNIISPSIDTSVKLLSGGNLQRLILAREISRQPNLLIAAYPTQGLDIQSAEFTRKLILEQRREGGAIFFTSEDLDEIMALSDRIMVIYEGQLMGIVTPKAVGKEELGLMMTGTPKEEIL